MSCVPVKEVCKAPTDIKDYGWDYADETFRYFRLGAEFATGVHVRPTVETGYEYVSSGGQTSGKKEPKWPTTLGGIVQSGSILFTCVALSTDGLFRYIQSSTWTPEDADIAIVSSAIVNSAGTQAATVVISGGTDGNIRDAVNEVTLNDGIKLHRIVRLTIEDEAD